MTNSYLLPIIFTGKTIIGKERIIKNYLSNNLLPTKNQLISVIILLLASRFSFAQEQQQCHWQSSNQQATAFDLTLADEVDELPMRRLNEDIVIRSIRVNRYNVFDPNNPDEQNSLFSWLNSIHIVTKEQVVRDILHFTEGDPYQLVNQQGSERHLRGSKYIYDARIRPLRLCGNQMDVEVTTRDLWSLTPSLNFSRTGGKSKQRVAISDSNFLGTGKHLTLARSKEDNTTDLFFGYRDPNILGTKRKAEIELSDNSDGYRQFISLQLPFYSLGSTHSYGFDFNNEKRLDPIYHQTILSSEFNHKLQQANVFWGLSEGYINKQSIRWRYGLTYTKDQFETTQLHHLMDTLPVNRTLFYPWLGIELLEDRFSKLENYHSMRRTEDINLGRHIKASIGYSDRSLSRDHSAIVIKSYYKNAIKMDQQLIDFQGSFRTLWQTKAGKIEDLLFKLTTNYYNFYDDKWVFFTSLTLNYSKNLTKDKQLFLGGDTGLRGYPLRHLEAQQTALLSIEQRYYTDQYWFNLVRVGAAAYFDIGRAWHNEHHPTFNQYNAHQWLSNIGIGLRLTPTRADANHVVHVDLAFPLNSSENIDNMQLIIKVRQSF